MCLSCLSWNTCGFSALCHAAGGPSEVPLLADSGWLLYSCGVGCAWGWGLSCDSCPVPPLFFFFVPAQLPLLLLPLQGFAPLPSGLACLSPACWSTPRIGLEGSGCVLFLRACSVRCFPWGLFAGLILLRLLAGLCGLCTLCQGAPVAVLSAGFAGGVPLLPFLYLRVGVLLAEVSPEFAGYEGGLGCPSWFVILFLCLLILHHFLELGWFLVTGWWPLLRLLVLDSSDDRLHLPDTFASASTPISGSWMVQAPAFSCALPWVRPSRFLCWLLA